VTLSCSRDQVDLTLWSLRSVAEIEVELQVAVLVAAGCLIFLFSCSELCWNFVPNRY
jgi:hypothetical protein